MRWWQTRKRDADLERELRSDLELEEEEQRERGLSPEEARYAARRAFGNPTLIREQTHAIWSWNRLASLPRALRYSVRTLRRTPGFAAIAVLVMALGMGANIALFTVVRAVLLKPLPFKDPGRLVRLYEADAHGAIDYNVVAPGTFADWQRQSQSFEQMALEKTYDYSFSGADNRLPERVAVEAASWKIFSILGVQASLGRLFLASDDSRNAEGTVVLTWGFWKRRYNGDPSVLGSKILLDTKPYTVIGILPAWFTYPDPKVQLWTALYHEKPPRFMELHAAHNFDVVARLKSGVTIAQATAELNSIQREIRKRFPNGPIFDAANIRGLLEAQVHDVKSTLYVLLAATGCLLLIACLNISNLLIARAAARRKETAIRAALGASLGSLLLDQVTESLLIALAGGTLGIGFAYLIVQWLVHVREDIPRAEAIHMDGVVLLFAFGIMVICGVAAGLIPSLSSNGAAILKALQESTRSYSGTLGRVRLRRVLLSLEVGLTVVLLVTAGLLLRTYQKLRSVNLGCTTQNVLTMSVSLPGARYQTPQQRVSFYEQLLGRVTHLPGVQAAGLTTTLPGQGIMRDDALTIAEIPLQRSGQYLDALTRFVDPDYFHALQIPLLEGRTFFPNERLGRSAVAVVDQAFVRTYLHGSNPIGKHIHDDQGYAISTYEIVGVVGDTLISQNEASRPTVYYPIYTGFEDSVTLVVRTNHDPLSLALPVQKVISELDRDLPVADILTMNQIAGKNTLDAAFDATLLLSFSVLSLVLAAVGLFGVLSYVVAQRTTELGIRMALGARREQVMYLMLSDGLRPALFGLLMGMLASAGVTRVVQSMLYGTSPSDPLVLALVAMVLLLVATAACALPAWHAGRLDPMQALRSE